MTTATTAPVRKREDVPTEDGATTGCHKCGQALILRLVHVPINGVIDVIDPRNYATGAWYHMERNECPYAVPYGD